jgi:hypothetical protein
MGLLSLLYVRWRCRKMPPEYVTQLIIETFIKEEIKKQGGLKL